MRNNCFSQLRFKILDVLLFGNLFLNGLLMEITAITIQLFIDLKKIQNTKKKIRPNLLKIIFFVTIIYTQF